MDSNSVVNTEKKEITLNLDRGAVQHLLPLVKSAVKSARARMGFYRNRYNSNPTKAAKAEAQRDCLLPLLERLESLSLGPWLALREEEGAGDE